MMKCRRLLFIAVFVCLALPIATSVLVADPQSSQDQLPQTLYFIKDRLVIEEIQYKQDCTLSALKGTGKLKLKIGIGNDEGMNLKDVEFGTESSLSKPALVADSSGKILKADWFMEITPITKGTTLCSNSLTLSIDQISLHAAVDVDLDKCEFKMLAKAYLAMPFKDNQGKQLELSFYDNITDEKKTALQTAGSPCADGNIALAVDTDGSVVFCAKGGSLKASGAGTSEDPDKDAFCIAGMKFKATKFDFDLNYKKQDSGGSYKTTFTFTCYEASLATNLPWLTDNIGGNLRLKVKPKIDSTGKETDPGLTVDQDGNVTADLVLDKQNAKNEPIPIVGGTLGGFKIKLCNVEAVLEKNDFKQLVVHADITCPDFVNEAGQTAGQATGKPLEIKGCRFDILNCDFSREESQCTDQGTGQPSSSTDQQVPTSSVMGLAQGGSDGVLVASASPTAFLLAAGAKGGLGGGGRPLGTGVEPIRAAIGPFTVEIEDFVLDLSPDGPQNATNRPEDIRAPSWQGLYISKATVTLPPDLWSYENGDPVQISVSNCFIDGNGLSTSLELGSGSQAQSVKLASLGGFNANLTRLRIDIKRNRIVASDCAGTIQTDFGELNLAVKVSDDGVTASVDASQNPLEYEALGLKITISGGQVQMGSDGQWALWLDGGATLQVPSVEDTTLKFRGLGVDSKGNFVMAEGGGISLDAPVKMDFSVFTCTLSSFAIFQETNQSNEKEWVIELNGELSLSQDIPVTGTVSFEHLQIRQGPEGPRFAISGVGILVEIKDVARIAGRLEQDNDPKFGGNCLKGSADLELLFAGSAPIGGGFQFCTGSQGVWAVVGDAAIGQGQALPLGNTGLEVYKFRAGIAHNMDLADPSKFSAEQSAPQTTNVALLDALTPQPGSGKWLVIAGCGVQTLHSYDVFHAVGTLTIGLPRFDFRLLGDAWFLTDSEDPAKSQCKVTVDLDPAVPMFHVGAAVDLGIPDKDVLRVNGTLDLLLSPNDVHFDVGWPYPEKALNAALLKGLLSAKAGMHWTPTELAIRAGMAFDYYILKGKLDCGFGYNLSPTPPNPYLYGSIYASGEVDFIIISLGASAELAGAVCPECFAYDGEFCVSIGLPWPLPDIDCCAGFDGKYGNGECVIPR